MNLSFKSLFVVLLLIAAASAASAQRYWSYGSYGPKPRGYCGTPYGGGPQYGSGGGLQLCLPGASATKSGSAHGGSPRRRTQPPTAMKFAVMRTLCKLQPLARNRSRNGLSTNSARPTTTKFMIAVNTKTRCQPPVADLIRLATGTRNADAPLAV
jgi:hypothetical protein